MVDIANDLGSLLSSAAKDLASKHEAFLLKFFGSYENAKEFGHLYVIETHPTQILTQTEGNTHITYSLEQTMKIRLKTAEELEADGLI